MATDLETLLVRLEVSDAGFAANLGKAENRIASHEKRVNKSLVQIDKSLERSSNNFKTFAMQAGLAFGAGAAVTRIVKSADAYTVYENKLKSAINTQGEFNKVSAQLFKIAQDTKQPLTDLGTLYASLSGSFTNAQKAAFPIIETTERLSKAFLATGVGAQQAQSFILQFSQATAADFKAVAQEINTLIESAPALTKAIAEELGLKSASALKKFSQDGQLSVNNFFEAFNRATDKLGAKTDQMTLTVGQSFIQLDNAFAQFIGNTGAISGSVSGLAQSIGFLARNFDTLGNGALVVAGVMAARLVPALTASSLLYLRNTQQAIAYQAALARMAGVSTAAAGSVTLLNRALSLVGGPLGLLVLGVGYLALRTEELSDAQKISNDFMAQNERITSELAVASAERAKQLRQERQDLINKTKAEIEDTKAMIIKADIAAKAALSSQSSYVSGKIGASPEAVMAGSAADYGKAQLKDLDALLGSLNASVVASESAAVAQSKHGASIEATGASSGKAAKATKDNTKAIKDKTDALGGATKENSKSAEQAELLAKANSQSAEEYKRVSDALEIKNRLEQQGFKVGTALYNSNKKLLESEAQYKKQIDSTNESREDAKQAAEDYAQAMRAPIENALEGIQDTITDTFVGVFDGSVDSAADAADAIKGMFIRMAAELATLELFGADGFNIAGLARGVSGAGGGASGGGSVVGEVFKQGTSLLEKTGIGSALNSFGASALPSVFGTGAPIAGMVGPQAAGALGGLGIGLSSIALPVAGIALGALAGKVFGGKKPNPASTFSIDRTGGVLDLNTLTYRSKHLDNSVAQGIAGTFTQSIAGLQGSGFNLASAAILAGGVDRGRGFFTTGDFKSGKGKTEFFKQGDAASEEKALTKFISELAKESTNLADIMDKEMVEAVKNLSIEGKSLAQVLEELNFAAMRDDLRKAFETSVADDLTDAILPGFKALQEEGRRFEQQLADAKKLGSEQAIIQQIELLHQEKLKGLVKETGEAVTTVVDTVGKEARDLAADLQRRFSSLSNSFNDIIFDLTYGGSTGNTPVAQLGTLRNRVSELGNMARLGDATAGEELAKLLPVFYQLSGEVNGFNSMYEQDRQLSLGLAKDTKSVADRQIELQKRIAEASEATVDLLAGGVSGASSGANVNEVLTSAIKSGKISESDAKSIMRAAGFGGVFGSGNATAFFAGNSSANDLALRAVRARGIMGFATGGLVGGMEGIDSNLARLTKGEFVMNTAAVKSIGAGTLASMNTAGNDNHIKGLRDDIRRLTDVVAASGKMSASYLAELNSNTERMANLERAAVYSR